MIQTRLRRREESELAELGSGLLEAALAYRTPPTPLPGNRRSRRRGAGDGEPRPSIGPRTDDPAERIITAGTEGIAVLSPAKMEEVCRALDVAARARRWG